MCVDIFPVHTNANLHSDGVQYWGIVMGLSTGYGQWTKIYKLSNLSNCIFTKKNKIGNRSVRGRQN